MPRRVSPLSKWDGTFVLAGAGLKKAMPKPVKNNTDTKNTASKEVSGRTGTKASMEKEATKVPRRPPLIRDNPLAKVNEGANPSRGFFSPMF